MGSRTRYAGKRVRGSSRHTTTIESLNMMAMVDRTHTPHSHTTQRVVKIEQRERGEQQVRGRRGAPRQSEGSPAGEESESWTESERRLPRGSQRKK